MASQDDRFLKGAFTLTVAGFIAKMIGAVYRIPLYYVLGSEGVGLYQMAYPIYAIMLTASSAGLNVAISKAVAERWALGRKRDARGAFRVSLVLMTVIGLAGSIALYGLRNWIAVNLAKDPRAAVSIAAISPALFMASILSALRGWFQGIEEMTVPAVSQVLEQAGRLIALFGVAWALMPRGLEYAAAGASLGAVLGAGLGVLYAGAAYRMQLGRQQFKEKRERRRRSAAGVRDEPVAPGEPWSRATRAVLAVAIPISLASAVFGIAELVDLSFVPGRLQATGVVREEATRLYGQLTGAALPLVNLATVFTGALQMAIVPSVTAAVALRDRAGVRRRVQRSLSITLALALPAALGLYVLAEPIPALLYREHGLGPILGPAAPAILFLALQQVTAGILQGIGKVTVPLVNLGVAIVVKAALTFTLVGMPGVGVAGAALATSIYFGVAAALNLWAVYRYLGNVIDAGSTLRLSMAGAAMAVVAGLVYRSGSSLLGQGLSTIAAIGVGAVTYGVLAIVLRAVDPADLEAIPVAGRFLGRLYGSKR